MRIGHIDVITRTITEQVQTLENNKAGCKNCFELLEGGVKRNTHESYYRLILRKSTKLGVDEAYVQKSRFWRALALASQADIAHAALLKRTERV